MLSLLLFSSHFLELLLSFLPFNSQNPARHLGAQMTVTSLACLCKPVSQRKQSSQEKMPQTVHINQQFCTK